MTQNDHRLMSTPVSVNDGFKRADNRTWVIIGATVVIALLIVIALNVFFTKPKNVWPTSPVAPRVSPNAADGNQSGEPKTYDVAPPSRPEKDK